MSFTEESAGLLAGQLVAQSDAADAAVRARRMARQQVTAVTERPGETSPAETRSWALKKARQEYPQAILPGGPAKRSWVMMMPDGQAVIARQAPPPAGVLVRPEQWAAFDEAWRAGERAAEDLLLLAVYGQQACDEAGIV